MENQESCIWQCSCCGNVFDIDLEQPVNYLSPNLFECSLCVVVNEEREKVNLECLNA
ncbi:MAG: hypothetical protein ACRC79_03410 [Acinetobacter junii]